MHTVYADFAYTCSLHKTDVTGEVRFTYRIIPGRPAVTWANAAEGFSPAEPDEAEITAIHVRFEDDDDWRDPTKAETAFLGFIDALSPDNAWLLSEAMEDAA